MLRLNLGCDNYNCRIKEDLARYSILLDIFVHVFSTILRVKVPLGLDIEDYIYICNLKIATCYTRFFFYNFCKNHGAQILENNNNNLRIILRLISCHATLKSCYCHNPNYNVNSTQFNLNWSWFWHEYDFTHHPAWNSNLSERNIAEVFCLRPYLTILTTTKYNLTQLCSGGGGIYLPSWINPVTTSRTT